MTLTVRGAARVGGRRPECRGRDRLLLPPPPRRRFSRVFFSNSTPQLNSTRCLVAASYHLPDRLHHGLLILTYDRIAG